MSSRIGRPAKCGRCGKPGTILYDEQLSIELPGVSARCGYAACPEHAAELHEMMAEEFAAAKSGSRKEDHGRQD